MNTGMLETLSAVELSVDYYRNGLYCSEAIVRAFNEVYELGLAENSYKIATGFGSGMGESGCSCGAFTAGVMVLGLVAGRNKKSETEELVYKAVKQLHEEFRKQNKSVCCRILTKDVAWGSKEHKSQCEKYVSDSATIIETIIKESLYEYLPQVGTRTLAKKNLFRSLYKKWRKEK